MQLWDERHKEKESKSRYWSLGDEIRYLTFLGTGQWSKSVTASRATLLLNYLETTPWRTEPWVGQALDYARKCLEEEVGG